MASLIMVPALCVALAALGFAIISKYNPEELIKWLRAHQPMYPREHRTSDLKSTSLKPSPETKSPDNVPPPTDYKCILPPSQRATLPKVAEKYSEVQKSKLVGSYFNELIFRKNIIPFVANYRDCRPSMYTPMGFSMDDIKTLGDFPDYADLSGVPLPEISQGFKIETACPRPYRPFRWAYHQTMCKHLCLAYQRYKY